MNLIDKLLQRLRNGGERSVAVKKNIVGSLVLKGVSMVVTFVLVPLTIGYVSAELYGVWLTLSSMLMWFGFMDIGFTQGLKNKLTEAIAAQDWEKGKSLVSTTYFLMFLIFVPICIILEFIVPLIDWTSLLNVDVQYETEIREVIRVLVVLACVQMIVNVLVSVVAAFQKVALSNSFMVIGNALSLIIICVLRVTCPPSLLALAFALAAMPILVTIVASVILFLGKYRKIAPRVGYIRTSYISELFGLGYKFFLINVQVLVVYQSTNLLISYVSSPLEVTTYNIAYKLLSIAMMVFAIITAPLWPAYTDAYYREDYNWMKEMKRKMDKVFYLSVAGCLFLALFSGIIYKVWIGDQVDIPLMMTLFVTFYTIVYCWLTLNGTLIVGMGKLKLDVIIVVAGMICHIPLSLLLSRYIGCYGVISSMIFISFVYGLIYHIQVGKLLNKTATGIWNQ